MDLMHARRREKSLHTNHRSVTPTFQSAPSRLENRRYALPLRFRGAKRELLLGGILTLSLLAGERQAFMQWHSLATRWRHRRLATSPTSANDSPPLPQGEFISDTYQGRGEGECLRTLTAISAGVARDRVFVFQLECFITNPEVLPICSKPPPVWRNPELRGARASGRFEPHFLSGH